MWQAEWYVFCLLVYQRPLRLPNYHPFKDLAMGHNAFKQLSDEEKERIRAKVDEIHKEFNGALKNMPFPLFFIFRWGIQWMEWSVWKDKCALCIIHEWGEGKGLETRHKYMDFEKFFLVFKLGFVVHFGINSKFDWIGLRKLWGKMGQWKLVCFSEDDLFNINVICNSCFLSAFTSWQCYRSGELINWMSCGARMVNVI